MTVAFSALTGKPSRHSEKSSTRVSKALVTWYARFEIVLGRALCDRQWCTEHPGLRSANVSGVMPTGLSDRSDGVQRVVLPADLSSVPAARSLIRTDLVARGVWDEVVDNTLLVVTELVSNAVTHAGPVVHGHENGIMMVWTVENGL